MTARTTETPQKSHALVRKLEGHRAHDAGVRETRPSGEGDEASMRGTATRGDQQENTERQECAGVLQLMAACRGAPNGLMAEVMEGHVRLLKMAGTPLKHRPLKN